MATETRSSTQAAALERRLPRRTVLRWGALGAGVLVTGCRGVIVTDLERLATAYPDTATRIAAAAPPTPTRLPTSTPPSARAFGFDTAMALTPTSEFYRIQYGEVPDAMAESAYRLELDGMVASPAAFTLDELRGFADQTVMRTLECISNPAGGDLVGNAIWRGVRLADVLDRAGADRSAPELRLESRDGYHTGIDMALARDPESFLVFEMNGAPLPVAHGQPVRCLFPGRYGQKQPKWLSRITVQSTRHLGHWESQGWSDAAPIQINSRIDVPATGATVPAAGEDVVFHGIAFSDLSGVVEVELLLDERPVGTAQLTKAPRPYDDTVWTEWRWRWPEPTPGNHTLMARARDGNGVAQRRERQGLLEGTKPDGTSAMHRIRFFVPEAVG